MNQSDSGKHWEVSCGEYRTLRLRSPDEIKRLLPALLWNPQKWEQQWSWEKVPLGTAAGRRQNTIEPQRNWKRESQEKAKEEAGVVSDVVEKTA